MWLAAVSASHAASCKPGCLTVAASPEQASKRTLHGYRPEQGQNPDQCLPQPFYVSGRATGQRQATQWVGSHWAGLAWPLLPRSCGVHGMQGRARSGHRSCWRGLAAVLEQQRAGVGRGAGHVELHAQLAVQLVGQRPHRGPPPPPSPAWPSQPAAHQRRGSGSRMPGFPDLLPLSQSQGRLLWTLDSETTHSAWAAYPQRPPELHLHLGAHGEGGQQRSGIP